MTDHSEREGDPRRKRSNLSLTTNDVVKGDLLRICFESPSSVTRRAGLQKPFDRGVKTRHDRVNEHHAANSIRMSRREEAHVKATKGRSDEDQRALDAAFLQEKT